MPAIAPAGTRTDKPDNRARAAAQAPRRMPKSLHEEGCIVVDGETVRAGMPPAAWADKLGNRSAPDWVLEHYAAGVASS